MYRIVWASHEAGLPIVPPLPNNMWDQVGWVEDDRTLAQELQRSLGQRAGRPRRSVRFYLAGLPSHPWIANLTANRTPYQRLYLAFEIVKNQLYVLAESPARVVTPKGRPPERPHGFTSQPRMVGLELRASAEQPLLRQMRIAA
jgi:hypothetical protein